MNILQTGDDATNDLKLAKVQSLVVHKSQILKELKRDKMDLDVYERMMSNLVNEN